MIDQMSNEPGVANLSGPEFAAEVGSRMIEALTGQAELGATEQERNEARAAFNQVGQVERTLVAIGGMMQNTAEGAWDMVKSLANAPGETLRNAATAILQGGQVALEGVKQMTGMEGADVDRVLRQIASGENPEQVLQEANRQVEQQQGRQQPTADQTLSNVSQGPSQAPPVDEEAARGLRSLQGVRNVTQARLPEGTGAIEGRGERRFVGRQEASRLANRNVIQGLSQQQIDRALGRERDPGRFNLRSFIRFAQGTPSLVGPQIAGQGLAINEARDQQARSRERATLRDQTQFMTAQTAAQREAREGRREGREERRQDFEQASGLVDQATNFDNPRAVRETAFRRLASEGLEGNEAAARGARQAAVATIMQEAQAGAIGSFFPQMFGGSSRPFLRGYFSDLIAGRQPTTDISGQLSGFELTNRGELRDVDGRVLGNINALPQSVRSMLEFLIAIDNQED